MKKLSPTQLDALKELGTIGAGHAASSLSILLGMRVDILPPIVQLLPLAKIADFLGGAEKEVTSIYFQLGGEVAGSITWIISKADAERMLSLLLDKEINSITALDRYEESALKELGNISTGAYIVALSGLTGCKMICSTPSLATDMLGAVLNEILITVASDTDQLVLIESSFIIGKDTLHGNLLLIPDIKSMELILKTLKVD